MSNWNNALDPPIVLPQQPPQLVADIPAPPGLTPLGLNHWRDKDLIPT